MSAVGGMLTSLSASEEAVILSCDARVSAAKLTSPSELRHDWTSRPTCSTSTVTPVTFTGLASGTRMFQVPSRNDVASPSSVRRATGSRRKMRNECLAGS